MGFIFSNFEGIQLTPKEHKCKVNYFSLTRQVQQLSHC